MNQLKTRYETMLSIPLGLRAKLYIKPWASIAIAFFTLGFTFDSLIGQSDLKNFQMSALEKYNVYQNSYQAALEGCKVALADTPNECNFFTEVVKPEDMTAPEQLSAKVDQVAAYDAITKSRLRTYLQSFNAQLKEPLAESESQFLKNYKIGLNKANQDIQEYHESHFLLSKENMNWKSFTLAQWTHSSWLSLLSNFLILALFAFYLEQRVGPAFLLLIYMLGGYVAMFIEAPFLVDGQIASGGTANAMAIIGAYGFFFFKEKIALSRMLIPVWFYALAFLVLGNIFYLEGDIKTNVVLLGHVAGFLVGVASGLVVSWMVWVQSTFLFAKEQTAYFKAKKTADPLKKINFMLEILEINPYNFFAVEYMFRSIKKYKLEATAIPEETARKICRTIVHIVGGDFKVSDFEIYAILNLIPMSWTLTDLPMPTLGATELKIIEGKIMEGDWRLAIRLFDVYVIQHKGSAQVDAIKQTVQKLIVHAESPSNSQSHQNIEWLRVYVIFHGKTVLGQMLAEKYDDKTAAG